jgi:hypothetical protein
MVQFRPMKKLTHTLLWAVMLTLAACAPAEVSVTLTPAPPPTVTTAPTAVPPTATTAPTATATEANVAPTPESQFAPVTDADWQLGLKTARVTIVEYGDFQ